MPAARSLRFSIAAWRACRGMNGMMGLGAGAPGKPASRKALFTLSVMPARRLRKPRRSATIHRRQGRADQRQRHGRARGKRPAPRDHPRPQCACPKTAPPKTPNALLSVIV